MHLLSIHSQASPYWDSLVSIYLQSFPIDERRPVSDIARLLVDEPRYALYAITSNDNHRAMQDNAEHPTQSDEMLHCTSITSQQTFGLLTTWSLNGFTYIEHFALAPEVRGQGYGTEALQTLIAQTPQPLILEVEPPTDEPTRRRIGFYERNGFTLYNYPYMQPSYTANGQSVPLRLMALGFERTTGKATSSELFQRGKASYSLSFIARTLHREVYGGLSF